MSKLWNEINWWVFYFIAAFGYNVSTFVTMIITGAASGWLLLPLVAGGGALYFAHRASHKKLLFSL